MSRLYVEVAQRHIVQGEPKDSERCAIALAMAERLHGLGVEISVNAFGSVDISRGDVVLTGDLPDTAARFVDAFDGGLPVGPIAFVVDLEAIEDEPIDPELAAVLAERITRRGEAPSWPLWAAASAPTPIRGARSRYLLASPMAAGRDRPTESLPRCHGRGAGSRAPAKAG